MNLTPPFPSDDELAMLVAAARGVMRNACARHSGFRVGAALLTNDGEIVVGVNVESSSYGGTICAERSALVAALSAGHREFRAIAVAGDTHEPLAPCGICRQLLHDYAPGLWVICAGAEESRVVALGDLLPMAFDASALEGDERG